VKGAWPVSDESTALLRGQLERALTGDTEARQRRQHTPCYLSVDVIPPDFTGDDCLDFVMEARRLACDRRYWERLRQLKLRFSRAP
jgi:hypothetical protein